MKNHRFPWLRNRTTDNRKCEKARNIKEKRTIEMFKYGYIAGHIEVKEPSNLILQIPYDQNWRFYVDGKKVNSYESLGIYSTLYLDEGFHDIRAIYIPRGLKLGITITIISLIIMFIWLRMNEL